MGKLLRARMMAVVLALTLAVAMACSASAAKKASEPQRSKFDRYFQITPMKVVIVQGEWESCKPNCPRWIAADGDISETSPAQFRKVLKQAGKMKLPVLINSPGGSVEAALEIGRMLRKAGLSVAVAETSFVGCGPADKSCKLPPERQGVYTGRAATWTGYCASACPLILAGGVSRFANRGTEVGVHQMRTVLERERIRYRETFRVEKGRKTLISRKVLSRKLITNESFGISKTMQRTLKTYLAEMGVSAALIDEMNKAPYSSLNMLPDGRLLALKLVTAERGIDNLVGSGACNAPAPGPNCVAVAKPPPPLGEMTVRLVRQIGGCEPNCAEWIAADGPITRNSPDRFRAAIASAGDRKFPVVLNSRGGDLQAAMDVGSMIRAAGLTTVIARTRVFSCEGKLCDDKASLQKPFAGHMQAFGVCDRECLYVLAGGVKRYHALMAEGDFALPGERSGKVYQTARSYLEGMGVSSAVLEDAAAVTTDMPLHLIRPQLLVYGFGTQTASPDFLVDEFACKGSAPLPNCRMAPALLAAAKPTAPASPQDSAPAPQQPKLASTQPPADTPAKNIAPVSKAAPGASAKPAVAPASKRAAKPHPHHLVIYGGL